MKRLLVLVLVLLLLLTGCNDSTSANLAATTLPVYEFTLRLCEGTGLTVTRLITENVSCLHDYTLQVRQMQAISKADAVIISGVGLEDFLHSALQSAKTVIDASSGLTLLEGSHHDHEDHGHGHAHAEDPHVWLSPENAKVMATNICDSLCKQYPSHTDLFRGNLSSLLSDLDALQAYGQQQLSTLSYRDLITFHDGFSYLAESFDLHIVKAIEEESGSEASAAQLTEIIGIVRQHHIPALFTEINGATAAAQIIAAETGAAVYALDMAMHGAGYFDSMYHNIDTLKGALG